jgi:hypothetical protein
MSMPVSSQDGTLQAKFVQLINEKMQRNHIISALSSQLTAAEQEKKKPRSNSWKHS